MEHASGQGTAAPNATELAEYGRRKGLFAEQIGAWRAACMSANAGAPQQTRSQPTQAQEDKKRIRQLEKDLQRKEKAPNSPLSSQSL